MNLTNRMGLPEAIVRAVSFDSYKPGNVISVTTLLRPAYQRKLEQEHADKLTEDAADRIWSMIGQIGHSIVERIDTGGMKEQRLYATINGKRVSGQIDLFENGVLTDFKFTTVYKQDGSPEWEQQLNAYAFLLAENGHEVKRLQIVAVFRDWKKSKAGIDGHPEAAVKIIPVKLWTLDKQRDFIENRLLEHSSNTPTPCTDEERWASKPVFAVMEKGRKRATKLHDSQEEANSHAERIGATVEERPKTYARCEGYCPVSKFCPIYRGTNAEK